MSLIEVLRSLSAAGESSAEHVEAVREVERGLLSCLTTPPLPERSCSLTKPTGKDRN